MNTIFSLLNLMCVKSACVTPNVVGYVIENSEYYAGELIVGEYLNEKAKISYECRGNQKISTCDGNEWIPEIVASKCKSFCVIPSLTQIELLGNEVGDEIPEKQTVSFKCARPNEISIGNGENIGITICIDGIFSPPLKCVRNDGSLCLLSNLKNAFGLREIINDYRYSKYVEHGVDVEFICEENFRSKTNKINCDSGNFLEIDSLCLKSCEISNISDKNAQIINRENFIKSGQFISYSCLNSHPISFNDKSNTFNMFLKTGIGSIFCRNGTFVNNQQLCFDGCIVPSGNLNQRYLPNGEILKNFNCGGIVINFTCNGNTLTPILDCMSGEPTEEIPIINFPVLEVIGNKVYENYNVFYRCPSTHPISHLDLIRKKQSVKSFGVFNKKFLNQFVCKKGCLIPEEIIFDDRFVLNNERIENFGCPFGKIPNTKSALCKGSSFEPNINCVYDAKPGENKSVCLIPEINDSSIEQESIAVGSDLLLTCRTVQYKLKCMPDGDFSPRMPTNCVSNALNSDYFKENECHDISEIIPNTGLNTAVSILFEGNFIPETSCYENSQSCDRPSIPKSSTNSSNFNAKIPNGGSLRFTCQSGHSISNTFNNYIDVICVNNELNFNELPKCIPKYRIMKNLFNARFSKSVLSVNEPSKIECVPGFTPNAEYIYWNGIHFSITEKNICSLKCEVPTDIPNGKINEMQSGIKFVEIENELDYTCNKNHIKQSLENCACKENDGKLKFIPEPKCCCATKFANICTSCAVTYALISLAIIIPLIIIGIIFTVCYIKVWK